VREQGAEIFGRSPLLRLATEGGLRITTPKGSLNCGRVILALNGHVESLSLYRHRLMHVYTYVGMTRALTAAEQRRLDGEPEWGLIPADLACGEDSELRRQRRRQPAPKKLYSGPFMGLGARAHLWWTQRRAGREFQRRDRCAATRYRTSQRRAECPTPDPRRTVVHRLTMAARIVRAH